MLFPLTKHGKQILRQRIRLKLHKGLEHDELHMGCHGNVHPATT
jgi:hypothetical protein